MAVHCSGTVDSCAALPGPGLKRRAGRGGSGCGRGAYPEQTAMTINRAPTQRADVVGQRSGTHAWLHRRAAPVWL